MMCMDFYAGGKENLMSIRQFHVCKIMDAMMAQVQLFLKLSR